MNESKHSQHKVHNSPRFRIFVHLLAGFCLMATADNSGLTKLISNSFNFILGDFEYAGVIASIMATIFSGLLIVVGYFISSRLLTVIDKSDLKEMSRMWIILLLPIIYFVAVFPLVTGIEMLTNVVAEK
jgi:cell division protein FtsX